MNFLINNNLPPAIARALNELTKSEGHSVVSLRERFPANSADIDWVTHLKKEGGWAVVSQDKFSKGDAERRAFRECGMPIFCLARQWGKMTYWNKAENLVRWWPSITEQALLIEGAAAFRVPWAFSAARKFQQLHI